MERKERCALIDWVRLRDKSRSKPRDRLGMQVGWMPPYGVYMISERGPTAVPQVCARPRGSPRHPRSGNRIPPGGRSSQVKPMNDEDDRSPLQIEVSVRSSRASLSVKGNDIPPLMCRRMSACTDPETVLLEIQWRAEPASSYNIGLSELHQPSIGFLSHTRILQASLPIDSSLHPS